MAGTTSVVDTTTTTVILSTTDKGDLITATIQESFNASDVSNTVFMCVLYVILGSIAILANTTNIIVFMTSRELRRNHIYVIIIDVGEIVNGIALILTSTGRATQLSLGTFNTPISVHDCFFHRYWPVPLLLGTEIPAVMTMLTSMERIIAVHKPLLYSTVFSLKLKILYTFCGVLFLAGSIAWAAFSALGNPTMTSTQHCSIVSSTDKAYSTFHFAFVPLAYVCSFLSLCFIAFLQKDSNHSPLYSYHQRQLTTYIMMTAIDIGLVTIPSVVLLGASYGLYQPNDIVHGLSYSTSGFLSLCHIAVNVVYNRDYRKQIGLMPGWCPCSKPAKSATIANVTCSSNNPHRISPVIT